MLNIVDDTQWYKGGLRFKCTGCGQCCTGSPGAVWVTEEEVAAIAAHLQMPVEQFTRKYVRVVNGSLSLVERPGNYDCVFLQNNKCSVYSVRPKQCRTFPWWKHQLTSRQEWENAGRYCEGINHPDGTLFTFEEIQQNLH